MEGAEGILHYHRGKQSVLYTWRLMDLQNNMFEAYSIWCGIIIDIKLGMKDIMVFGDSNIIIKVALNHSNPKLIKLQGIIKQV